LINARISRSSGSGRREVVNCGSRARAKAQQAAQQALDGAYHQTVEPPKSLAVEERLDQPIRAGSLKCPGVFTGGRRWLLIFNPS
jgi:hypothetical protein